MSEHKYKVGDKVVITGNISGHGFEVGEVVEIASLDGDSLYTSVDVEGYVWWIVEDDCVLLDDGLGEAFKRSLPMKFNIKTNTGAYNFDGMYEVDNLGWVTDDDGDLVKLEDLLEPNDFDPLYEVTDEFGHKVDYTDLPSLDKHFYPAGTNVEIISNMKSGHKFEVGDVVHLATTLYEGDIAKAYSQDGGQYWWVRFEEVKPVKDKDVKYDGYTKPVETYTWVYKEDPVAEKVDMVDHPPHYGQGSIECIDYIEDFLTRDEYIGYLRGNIAKYMHRFRYKNGVEDVEKAKWYLERLIETLRKET